MPYEDDYKMWLEKSLIEMNPDWVCDGMTDKEFTHKWCEENCGKDNAYIMPKCLHMYYHHIVRADRKTENSSEIPNNCEHITEDGVTCAKYPACDDCPDNPLNKVKGSERLVKGSEQTDCGDFADRLAYERGVKHAWEVAQKVFNSTVTFYEAEDVAKQIDKDINVRSKDEPQTENLFTDKYGDVWEWRGDAWYCISGDEPQTETEIAKAIVHKMIDDAVIAEDAYPDLRQKMHDAVDEYEPQTDCAWK